MKNRFIDFIRSNNLITPNDNIIVALSGGSDSVLLLYLMKECKDELQVKSLYAAHVNHGIRGENARRDMLFCRKLCDQWNIPIIIDVVNVPKESESSGESIEEAARRIRYNSLKKHAIHLSAKIATAHNLSDNTETVLFNLIRGTGIQGVSGISMANRNIIRPLLFATKEEIELHCKSKNLSYVYDDSNDNVNYSRNRIRKNIIPELKQINPSLDYAVGKFSNIAIDLVDFLDKESKNIIQESFISEYVFDKLIIANYPKALRINAYKSMIVSTINVEYKHYLSIDELVFQEGSIVLPSNIIVHADKNTINFNFKDIVIEPFQYDVIVEKEILINGKEYCPKIYEKDEFEKILKINNLFYNYCFDYDKIIGSLYVRQRCNGDSYKPVNRGEKTLKKLFNESKFTQETRLKLPVLCDENGIVMVYGFGCDERVKITQETNKIFVFVEKSLI